MQRSSQNPDGSRWDTEITKQVEIVIDKTFPESVRDFIFHSIQAWLPLDRLRFHTPEKKRKGDFDAYACFVCLFYLLSAV
jgi:hypothetical protein